MSQRGAFRRAYLPAIEGVDGVRPITISTSAISMPVLPACCSAPHPYRAVWQGISHVVPGQWLKSLFSGSTKIRQWTYTIAYPPTVICLWSHIIRALTGKNTGLLGGGGSEWVLNVEYEKIKIRVCVLILQTFCIGRSLAQIKNY